MKVSPIALGCMSFGNAEPWMVEKEEAKKVIGKALELGINFFDTANVYSSGRSEEILGEILKDVRNDIVIASKVFFQWAKSRINMVFRENIFFRK